MENQQSGHHLEGSAVHRTLSEVLAEFDVDVERDGDLPLEALEQFDSMRMLEFVAALEAIGFSVPEVEVEPGLTLAGMLGGFPLAEGAANALGEGTQAARVELLPVDAADVGFLHALATGEESGFRWRYRGSVPPLEQFAAQLWHGVLEQFVVVTAQGGRPIGHVVAYEADLANRHVKAGGIGFSTGAQAAGLLEGILLLLDRLFAAYDFRKIYFEIPRPNWELFAAGTKGWVTIEGTLKGHLFMDGGYVDLIVGSVGRLPSGGKFHSMIGDDAGLH